MQEKVKIIPAAVFVIYSASILFSVKNHIQKSDNYISFEKTPPMEKIKKRIDKRGIKKEASIAIDEFIAKMEKAGLDISNFYRDFRPQMIFSVSHTDGFYDTENKKLIVDIGNVRETTLRGLLDMASTIRTDSFIANGFERTSYKTKNSHRQIQHIGYGLNEGYKDILLSRLFTLDGYYPIIKEITSIIENLVGKKNMEKFFVEGDLDGLMKSLSIEHGFYEAYSWLKSIDDLYSAIYLDDPFKKMIADRVYRKLLIELSKCTVDEAGDLYLNRDKNPEKREQAKEMLHYLNSVLIRRKKVPFLPGLREKDLELLQTYSDDELVLLPRNYQMRI